MKKSLHFVGGLLGLMTFFPLSARAYFNADTGYDARVTGLGWAFTGMADSVDAAGENNAGLATLRRPVIGFSVVTPVRQESTYQTVVTYPLASRWTLYAMGTTTFEHYNIRIQSHEFVLGAAVRAFDYHALRVSGG